MKEEIKGKDIVVFVSGVNSKGKKDASGAFVPESKKFAKIHNIPVENVFYVDCTKRVSPTTRAEIVEKALRNKKGANLKSIAFFGHGWSTGIQFGFNLKNCYLLSKLIADCSDSDVKIGLFACLTAENSIKDNDHRRIGPGTDGGFADRLRDNLVRNGVEYGWVDAHKTAGHAVWNPYVVRFLCESVKYLEYGAVGGGWIVEPGSRYWRYWVKMLKCDGSNLRWTYLFEEELDIKNRLAKNIQ